VHKGINIIPLRIENAIPTKTLEYFISAPHWLDALTVPLELHINKLAASVKALLSKHGAHPAAPVVATVPVAAAAVQASEVRPLQATDRATKPGTPKWLVPSLVAVALAGGVLVTGFWWRANRGTASDQPAPSIADGAPAEGQQAAPAPIPAAAAPRASAPAAPRPAKPDAVTLTADAAPAVAPVKNANLYIDFRNNLSEGSVSLDVDGQQKWTEKLGVGLKGGAMSAVKMGRPSEDLRGSLNLAKGPHKITVVLIMPDGKIKDEKTETVNIDPGIPRTLRIRLSRFKSNLDLQTVVGKPESDGKTEAAKAAVDVKTKAADGKAHVTDAKAKPAVAAQASPSK
jgi:hypothetical protein